LQRTLEIGNACSILASITAPMGGNILKRLAIVIWWCGLVVLLLGLWNGWIEFSEGRQCAPILHAKASRFAIAEATPAPPECSEKPDSGGKFDGGSINWRCFDALLKQDTSKTQTPQAILDAEARCDGLSARTDHAWILGCMASLLFFALSFVLGGSFPKPPRITQ